MNNYVFGNTSTQRLSSCHTDIQIIMREALKRSPIDFGIAEGHRNLLRQQQLYKEGKTKCDGIQKFSKHQSNPSLAADVYAFVNGKASWDKVHLAIIAGVIISTTNELKDRGYIERTIKWGGTFGSKEFKGWDYPHHELY